MSNFGDIAAGIVTVLEANITNMKAYSFPYEGITAAPAAVVLPDIVEYQQAFGGNTFEATFRVVVLVSGADDLSGFEKLYDMIDPTATNAGFRQAIDADNTLNGSADDSQVVRIERIGRREVGQREWFGFDAIIEVVKTVA